MMERKVLYYPNILPPSQWLKWAMLYWDRASSIMPLGWEEKPTFNYPGEKKRYELMTYLWKEKVFEPTRPSNLIKDRALRRGFEAEFRKNIRSRRFRAKLTDNRIRTHMHINKVTMETIHFLIDSKLAEYHRDSDWLSVEENTLSLYIGLLAKYLADLDVDYTIPSTDRNEYEITIYGAKSPQSGFPSMTAEFLNILPVPRADTDIKDILSFRRKKEDELFQFREMIDSLQKEVSDADTEAEIKKLIVHWKEKAKRGRSVLNKSMKDSGIQTAFTSLKSLIDIKSPALLETFGFSVAHAPLQVSVPIVLGTAVVQVGLTLVDNANKRRAELRKSPFAYLYFAEQKGLI